MNNENTPVTGRKYAMIVLAVILIVILGLAGLFGGDDETSVEYENTSNGGPVAGTCMINGPRNVVCAPKRTPKGSPIVKLYEDGSATYKNGSKYSPNGKFQ